jgi:hypothetical protein
MLRSLTAALVAVVLVGSAQAGKYNRVLSIGDKAPAVAPLPGTDDKDHGLDCFKDKDVVVIVVTCNHCPVAVAYEDRIIDFAKKHAGADSKVGLLAVCVNDLDADRLPAMKVRAKKKGFNFSYVYDGSGKTGKAYGASVTPEFYVLNKERKIVYMGALDNSMNNPTKNYLEEAVQATLKGETPKVSETKARGCGVKYKR